MYERQRIQTTKQALGIMHKERTKISVQHRTELDKNIKRQRQTQRIPISCKENGKETKGRRIPVQNQKCEQ
jgi:hypothetical protein